MGRIGGAPEVHEAQRISDQNFAHFFQAQQYVILCAAGFYFLNQLNMYFFAKKEGSNSETMEFSHELFTKGNENEFHKIVRRNRFRDDAIDVMKV